MTAQRAAITSAVTTARTAVAGVDDDSTDSEVSAADAAIDALKVAIEGAADLPEGDADVAMAQGTLDTLEPQLAAAKTSRTAAIAKADEERGKANAALGKVMRAALGPPDAADTTALNNAAVTLSAAGLAVDAVTGAGALPTADGDPDSETLEAVDGSDTSLGDWMGMDYSHSEGTGTSKFSHEARVYTNKGPGERVDFADAGYTVIDAEGTATHGMVLLVSSGATQTGISLDDVMADDFTHSGRQSHAVPPNNVALFITGTFDGAPGRFRCTGTDCTSTNDGKGSPSALGGTWHFEPASGAMVHQPDAHYLYYGWWVRKDDEGMPTAASAFAARFGTDSGDSTDGLDDAGDLTAITGSATYVGNAAGKFALSNPLDGTGNGGHFTADAELEATFSGDDTGVTGMIDNFRLNDGTEDPGWSVELARGALGTSAGSITAPADDAATTTVDESLGTTWSINGNEAPASGTWSGTMYDEKPGNPSATGPGDGSNIPTTVIGTFYSEFSTIGRMVGAFGAEN